METTTKKPRSTTHYHKDFTEEERKKYNEYMRERMRHYIASPEVKARNNERNLARYHRSPEVKAKNNERNLARYHRKKLEAKN